MPMIFIPNFVFTINKLDLVFEIYAFLLVIHFVILNFLNKFSKNI